MSGVESGWSSGEFPVSDSNRYVGEFCKRGTIEAYVNGYRVVTMEI